MPWGSLGIRFWDARNHAIIFATGASVTKHLDGLPVLRKRRVRSGALRKWLSGRASPCQGEGRGFESLLPLHHFCPPPVALETSDGYHVYATYRSAAARYPGRAGGRRPKGGPAGLGEHCLAANSRWDNESAGQWQRPHGARSGHRRQRTSHLHRSARGLDRLAVRAEKVRMHPGTVSKLGHQRAAESSWATKSPREGRRLPGGFRR